MSADHYRDFLRAELGGENWVVARRTPNIVRKYGEDVICISPKRLAESERKYRSLYGDPHDAVRRQMYLALKGARLMLYAWQGERRARGLPDNHQELYATINEIEAAMAAEDERK